MIAMTLEFYKYSGEARIMEKSLGNSVVVCEGSLKENTSMYSPTFTVKTRDEFKSRSKPTYLVVSDFGKNYFVRDIIPNTDGTCSVICEEDVLTTFKEQIKDIEMVIERSSGDDINSYLSDTSMPVDVRPHTKIVPFTGGTGFDDTLHFIIHCAGPSGTD